MKIRFIVVSIMIICLLSSFAFAQGLEDLNLNQYFDSIITSASSSEESVPLDATIRVQLNGEIVDFKDANGNVSNPKIVNNRTMVPMRKIFEIFKANVDWNEEAKRVVATTETKEITLTIGSETAEIKDLKTNQASSITLDQAPLISDNRTLVPVRFIAEGLDKEVGWDNAQRAVIIIDENVFVEQLKNEVPTLEKLFALNISEMGAYASTSTIEGTLSYTDTETSKEESISINGTANIEVDASENMSAAIQFNTTGTDGQIMSSLRQQNYDHFDAKFVLLDGKVYLGVKDNGQYIWTDASDSVNAVEIPSTPNTLNKITSYEETYKLIRSYIGDLKLGSYDNLKGIISMLKLFINDDTVAITDKGFTIDLDLKAIINKMSNIDYSLPISDLRIKMNIELNGNVVSSEGLEFTLGVNSTESAEDLNVSIDINTKYDALNGAKIEAPVM